MKKILGILGRTRTLVLSLNVDSVAFQGNSACVSPWGPFKTLERSVDIKY